MFSLLSADTTIKRIRYLMGCFVEIQATAQTEETAVEAVEAAFHEIKRIEALLSRFKPESMVSNINQHASVQPVWVPEEVFHLLRQAKRYSLFSNGLFDITALPLTELWNKAENRNQIPSPEEIRQTLFSVGHVWIKLDAQEKTVFFDRPGMRIDLGAMGKGYAVDQAMLILRSCGIEDALISTGSTLYYAGRKTAAFGIQNPENEDQLAARVLLKNQAVSTSAQSERFWTIQGKRYGHILNPKTGYPAEGNTLSVSVIAASAIDSDILSTLLFLKNPDRFKKHKNQMTASRE